MEGARHHHKLIARLAAEADPKALGAKNLADLLATRLRISIADAKQRITDAELLGPRRSMTGESLPPVLPNVAAAQARGAIGAEHVQIIKKFFDKLPADIDATTRDQAEADLTRTATVFRTHRLPGGRRPPGPIAQPRRRPTR